MSTGEKLFEGKVVFITGASRGIGAATARYFAKHGAQCVLNARTESNLSAVADAIEQEAGLTPLLVAYDVADGAATSAAFSRIHKEYKRLDVLVNNAGVLADGLLGMIQVDVINATLNTNLTAVINHMQLASRLMARQKRGSIINITSIMGRFGDAGQTVYAASKAGIVGATLSAAKELAPQGIRVNAVAPGFIGTDMTKGLGEANLAKRLASIKSNRAGTPEEVASVIAFFASDASAYVTGQVLGVDGGMVI